MQIYEITRGQQINEGLLDAAKGAVQGYRDAKTDRKVAQKGTEIAKNVSKIWNDYVRQLEKSRAAAPPVQIDATAAPTPAKEPEPSPGTVVKTQAGNVVKGADGKWKSSAGEVTDPAEIKELERRAKQQVTLAAQNKQMSPASGIKEADTVSPGGIAIPAGAKTAKPVATAAAPTAGKQTISAVDAFRQRKDNVYLNALKQFVQKNLLSGLPYTRLQNADVIDSLITNMSKPENADPATQLPMWQQLVQQAAVADVLPASLSGAPAAATPAPTTTGNETPQELQPSVAATGKEVGADPTTLAKVGEVLRAKFTNNETDIGSTGDPAVDALLLNMGFKP
jgi:hypothetical protein